MPKSAKKRKDKAADFSKAKLKLGKGKQQPSNAIDTSFKARSIALPSQSIAKHADTAVPTTKRRLSLDDLILHLKHYSAATRKDALFGLREILDAHPHLLDMSLPTIIASTARIIGDEDASVRKSLLDFFSWLFPRVALDDLAPHSTTLLLFTTSAQTHIFPEIRVDAIRLLNIYLEYIPAAIVAGWDRESATGHQVLQGYLGILNAGTSFGDAEGPMKATSTASVVLTAASKLVVLQSLSRFLRHATSSSVNSPSNDIDTWYLASSFATRDAYLAFDNLVKPRLERVDSSVRDWCPEGDPSAEQYPAVFSAVGSIGSQWSLEELSHYTGNMEETVNENSVFLAHLARALHSTLISTFLDCAPAVFSPNGHVDETQARLILAVSDIAKCLYAPVLRNTSSATPSARTADDLRSILGYMSPYFPFTPQNSRDIKTEQTFEALNITYCELSSLAMMISADGSTKKPTQSNRRQQTERVANYVIQLLKGESTAISQLSRPITPQAYTAILPTLWSLVNTSVPESRDLARGVLLAVVEHGRKASSKSAVKQLSIEFIARLLLLDTDAQFNDNIGADVEVVTEWVNHLPKCLWELGSSNLTATEIILRFLIVSLHRKSPLVCDNQALRLLRSQLVPYFSMTHPTRGQIVGPYSKLPPGGPLRRLALGLAALINDTEDSALSSAVNSAVLGSEKEATYWRNIRSWS
ncbi:Ipi1-N domain-containing protein [Mycena chlorophos]|uniref:Pre-rRNA-processing protein n=1 Tax=Mycena chlorophos TaxID=658473 RepID=A0A8H6T6R3_MYCCL|nr:Ipi1-N domain-containing protein [Mycena chlorophos]